MKDKLLNKISSIHSQIDALEKELNGVQLSDDVDRTNKLNIGTKVITLQELSVKLFTNIEVFLDLGGSLNELPEDIKRFYLMVEELRKPLSDSDSEDVKKIKEFINSYKKENEL